MSESAPPTHASPTLAPAPTPVSAAGRIAVLDVLRGFALFGVFMVNLNYVSGPYMGVVGPDASALEQASRAVLKGLFESKFVTLFSLLFGMGLVLQFERAKSKGVDVARTYRRRLGLLFCMGVLHGTLLFEGDILFLYSLAGFALYRCRSWPVRKLVTTSVVLAAIGISLSCLWAFLPGDFMTDMGGEDDVWTERARRAATEGPLALTLGMRAFTFVAIQFIFSLVSFNWRVLALFFLGAALMKAGFLRAENRALHGRLALIGIALGMALEAFAAYVHWNHPGTKGLVALGGTLGHEFGSLTLAFGLAGAVNWIVHGGMLRRLSSWLACVGRTALTNYLTQSVLMNVVLYWYGFGLWDQWSQWSYMGLVVVLFALQIAVSVWWMSRFSIGPIEWAWRSLTYGRRQAWR